jgi:hypothetical protein
MKNHAITHIADGAFEFLIRGGKKYLETPNGYLHLAGWIEEALTWDDIKAEVPAAAYYMLQQAHRAAYDDDVDAMQTYLLAAEAIAEG